MGIKVFYVMYHLCYLLNNITKYYYYYDFYQVGTTNYNLNGNKNVKKFQKFSFQISFVCEFRLFFTGQAFNQFTYVKPSLYEINLCFGLVPPCDRLGQDPVLSIYQHF